MVRRIVLAAGALVVLVLLGVLGWLLVAPPELLRVADGYAAKIVCSNVFLAGRNGETVLGEDVQAPGNPVLKLVRIGVDRGRSAVRAAMLGVVAPATAVYRDGLGCTLVPDGDVASVEAVKLDAPEPTTPGPDWSVADSAEIDAILADPAMTGPGMRAVVVVKDGHIAGEVYGGGFGPETPLIGWSMSKTVNAILIGRQIQAGHIGLDDSGLFPEWASDGRKDIRLRDLMSMTSGLAFNEDYGDLADVTRMLYLEPDMAKFAMARPLLAKPGTVFSYSTGTAMLLTKLWMERVGDAQTALAYPRKALFDPLGMASAVLETDEAGTFVGGSYLYATARDWARIGQLLLQDGNWNGERLLPDGFVKMMATGNGLPGGYSKAQSWVLGPHESEDGTPIGLPADTFWLEGHDGQSVAVIPSAGLVIVRMGLTPWDRDYWPEKMAKAIVAVAQ